MKGKYKFRKYKKNYSRLFEEEKTLLNKIIPDKNQIEHIGSTSIPNLGGKGVIDILLVVPKKAIERTKKILLNNKYQQMNNKSGNVRISFKKSVGLLFKKRYHLHLTFQNSKTKKETLRFRTNLIKNSNLRDRYALLKMKAVIKAKGNGEIYRKLKDNFIKKYSK